MPQVERPSVAGHVQPVDGQADGKQQEGAFHNLPDERRRPLKPELLEAEKHGHAHDEEEEGEHHVGQRHAVPLGVLQHGEDVVSGAVVHKDHQHHGEASQHVEAHQALRPGCGVGVSHGVAG